MSVERSLESLRERDAHARREAQREFRRPFILEAGAGTGKTTELVARVLVWGLGPGWARAEEALRREAGPGPQHDAPPADRVAARLLRRVVAITFTEAAAAEMDARIGEALREVERGELPLGLHTDSLPESLAARRQRAHALRGALDHMVVQTIHAYCRRLLTEFPLEAGLHPRLEVDADGHVQAEVAREAVEACLARGYAAPGDPTLLALAERGYGPAEIETELLALLADGVPARALAGEPFSRERVAAWAAHLAGRLGAVTTAGGECLRELDGVPTAASTVACIDDTTERLREFTGDEAGALEVLLDWLKTRWQEAEIKRLKAWGAGRLGVRERNALGARAERLQEPAEALAALLVHLKRVDVGLLEEARRVFAPLLREVEDRMRRRGAATFSMLLNEARDLLVGENGVARRVRARIDQLLVDEFQDTDRHQCDILRAIALEGPQQERPGLFVVGDPKQSIYGWRNADLRAYREFMRVVDASGGVVERLSVNYRSDPPILEEVERVVAPVMLERDGIQPEFQSLVPSPARADASGFRSGSFRPVEYWVTTRWDAEAGEPCKTNAATAAEIEARALARDLRALHDAQRVAWRECGVLFRSRADWEVYLRALREADIPFAVEGDRSYYQRREIIEASALVRAVLDPNDHLALLALLRSAAVGVPDVALIPLWARDFASTVGELQAPGDPRLPGLRDTIEQVARSLPAGVPGLERVGGWEQSLMAAVEALAVLRHSFEEDPADAFVERMRTLFLLEATEAARYLGAWRTANLDRFFRQLADDLANGADAHAVLRRLRSAVSEEEEAEEGRPREIVDDAVRIFTIHGAKGLDFTHVYVMQLHKGSRPGLDGGLRADEFRGGFEYILAGTPTLGWDRVQRERDSVARAERVRTLYVAMTRAKRRLVLVGAWPEFQAGRVGGSHTELLASRREASLDFGAAMRELAGRGACDLVDATGVRWVFPGLVEEGSAPPTESPRRRQLVDPQAVAAESRLLRELCASAREQMARPFGGAASGEADDELEELFEDRRPRGAATAGPDVARAVGTAVHRFLERVDLAAAPEAEFERGRAALAADLRDRVDPAAFDAATAEARRLLDRLAAGPLWSRLRALAPQLVARELPVLLTPRAESGPAAFVSGVIDLVYRDPASGELVVADYKTDRVGGEAELLALSEAHARQGAAYQRALKEAFALAYTPRFEIWYLAAQRVVEPPTGA